MLCRDESSDRFKDGNANGVEKLVTSSEPQSNGLFLYRFHLIDFAQVVAREKVKERQDSILG